MAKEKLVKITIRLPEGLVRQAKHAAVDAGQNLQTVVREALKRHLGKRGN